MFVVSCASNADQNKPIGKTDTMGTLRALGALPAPVRTERKLLAAIPNRASAPLHLGEGNAWLEVTPRGMHDVPGAVIDGATVYRGAADDIDLVYVREEGRVEELRLARSTAAATHVSWTLRKGPDIATIQIVDGRIEAVDHQAIVRLRTEPAYAIDSNGTRRALQLELHGSTVDARLDVTGLVAPIAIDPAWVAAAAPSGLARVGTPMAVLSSGKVLRVGSKSPPAPV